MMNSGGGGGGHLGGLFSPQNNMLHMNHNDSLLDDAGNSRGQKEVIVKRKSSKSLLRPETPKSKMLGNSGA